MVTTIDGGGRVVVPKPLRVSLGLTAGTHLEISERDGTLVIEPSPVPMRLVRRGRGRVVVPETPLPPLSAEQVRAVLESVRR
jgi:AbrB family looped-hinge helix DNA binding protein